MTAGDISQNSRRVAKNTLFLYLRMLLLMLIGLFTSRIVLNALGVDDYGTYNVVYGLVMMFSIVSNSVSNAVNRFLTYSLGHEEGKDTHRIFSSSLIIMAGMSLLLILLAETVGLWYLRTKMILPEGRENAAFWVMQCCTMLMIVQFFSIPFNAVIIAHEQMKAFAGISILEAVLKLAVAFALRLSGSDKLILYAILMAAVALAIRGTYALYCKRHFEEARGRLVWDKDSLKKMLSFSGWSFLGNGTVVLNTKGIDLLTNQFFGVAINASRGIAGQVENITKQFVTNFLLALNPQIIKSWAGGNVSYCHELVAKGCKFSILIMMMFAVPMCFEGEQVLYLWLGQVPAHAVQFSVLTLFCVIVDMMANSVFQMILANGKVAAYYIVTSAISLLTFALAWVFFASGSGPESSYWAFIAVGLLTNVAKLAFARRLTGFRFTTFLKESLTGPIIAAASALALCWAITAIFPACTLRALCNIAVTMLSYCAMAYFFALTKGERAFVKDILNFRRK